MELREPIFARIQRNPLRRDVAADAVGPGSGCSLSMRSKQDPTES